jgi:alpha-beta hydrolase superfamily lysophospholipase
MDFNVKLNNGQVLTGLFQGKSENSRAVLILVHGLGEHIQRYLSWADMFGKEKIAFTGVDLPGHGRSDGKRGNIKNYALLREMSDILLSSTKRIFPGVPVFMYGHSLGGGVVLDYLLRNNPEIKGAIITAPWLRLSFEPARWKIIMAAVMKNLLPALTQPSGLVVDHISQDREVVENYISDPLVHGQISVSLFYGAMSAGKYALDHASDLKIPTLLMHGSDDKICSPEASREFSSGNGIVDLKIWEGGYHELHNEPFKNEVFTYISDWINNKLA